ncbi:MAG: GTPase HflX [Candidatus Cloacimonetes bacterium]|nr:GTPase HflX [Candidatus Cloacimonadota bacterium]
MTSEEKLIEITNKETIKAIMVSLCRQKDKLQDIEDSMNELERLADTAGVEIVGRFIQKRENPKAATYIGSGFAEMLKEEMEKLGADILIFDNELTPSQGRNLKKDYELETTDRTELILDIFHSHAHTNEAKLQVKLAELRYQLPRLKRLWTHLDSVRGSASGSKGASRGVGETQLELDKRKIREEIRSIDEQLSKLNIQLDTQRKKRREKYKLACVVGYTNAGKSTLFNSLTDAGVLEEDKLFATLDSTSKALNLGYGEDVIITDTVGFIANLPHQLVASFRATLKEAIEADLLIHVVDASDTRYEQLINEVNKVLAEIGASEIPQILVLNKIDLLPEVMIKMMHKKYPDAIYISAKQKTNMDYLKITLEEHLKQSVTFNLLIPYADSAVEALAHKKCELIEKEYRDNGVFLQVRINKEDMRLFEKYIVKA